jgi:hypothetical protein
MRRCAKSVAWRNGWLAVCLGLLTSCGATVLPPFPTPSEAQVARATLGTTEIAIHPVTASEDQLKYFGTRTTSRGFVPVWLNAANRHPTASILIDPAEFKIAPGTGGARPIEAENRVERAVERPTAIAGLVLSLPAPIIAAPFNIAAAQMRSEQEEAKRNLVSKQFFARSLGPNESASGFIYVADIGSDVSLLKDVAIVAVVRRLPLGSADPETMRIPLANSTGPR